MSILTLQFAEKFIRETVSKLPYNVNIMDDKGIIIASKDADRIGDFHEVAYGLLTGKIETGVVTDRDHFIGTKPGVNMLIDYKERHIGVICVTGAPESVESFAGFVKTAMETMLDYEIRMAHEQITWRKEERFLNYVLFEDNYQQDEALRMAQDFSLAKTEPASIIILRVPAGPTDFAIIRALSHGLMNARRPIAVKGRAYDYVVLKILQPDIAYNLRHFRQIITEYIEDATSRFPQGIDTDNLSYHVGSIQTCLDDYRKSFHHAQALYFHIRDGGRINFFYDHTLDFIRNSVPLNLYRDIFETVGSVFRDEERTVIVETIKTLESHNYNILKTSQDLHVHRNTVMSRLNKIKDTLNIVPMRSGPDREFLNELAFYLEKMH